MKYKIEFSYTTGSTFEDDSIEIDCLETMYNEDTNTCSYVYHWDTLEVAQNALLRMKEHYIWASSLNSVHKEILCPVWYKKSTKCKMVSDSKYSFNVIGNDNKEVRMYAAMYLGYFETLISAEIKMANNLHVESKNSFRI